MTDVKKETVMEIQENPPAAPGSGSLAQLRTIVIVAVAAIAAGVVGLYLRAASHTNHVALAEAPRPVTVERALPGRYRSAREYLGTILAWSTARVGPQYVSAYVGSVLVRPGDTVRRGEVVATLDCRSSSAVSKGIAARARALEERQAAVAHEAARVEGLVQGGFASPNEAEQLAARSQSQAADVESLRASLVEKNLQVDDCVLRAPFAGEIVERFVDPGAWVRPGNPVVMMIDRHTVRVAADAPESDFALVAPGARVQIRADALGAKLEARISRRAPAADDDTRTVRFEIDLANHDRKLPVGSTARLRLDLDDARAAAAVPISSATLRGDQATVFTVKDGTAHRVQARVIGERGDRLFLDPADVAPGSDVVTEGRALLDDGDRVSARRDAVAAPSSVAAPASGATP